MPEFRQSDLIGYVANKLKRLRMVDNIMFILVHESSNCIRYKEYLQKLYNEYELGTEELRLLSLYNYALSEIRELQLFIAYSDVCLSHVKKLMDIAEEIYKEGDVE